MAKRVAIIITAILIIDQIVKIWIKSGLFGFDGMYPSESIPIVEGFFDIHYTENKGMAFGTTLGDGVWAKYALSIFRLIAIVAIGVYVVKLLRDPRIHKGLIYAMALIFAGATGNLIDGMFYDYIFGLNPDHPWNLIRDDQGVIVQIDHGDPVLRESGFLLGCVVDMFRFTSRWPAYFPKGMAGEEIFGAIWNIADFSISAGVTLIILRYRTFFRKLSVPTSVEGDDTAAVLQETTKSHQIGWGRWTIYLILAIVFFFLCLVGGSHLWNKITGSVDPGIISLLSLVLAYLSFWGMRDYIKP